MAPGWQVASQSQTGSLYINPRKTVNALVQSSRSPPVHFTFQTSRAKFQFKGPDNSPIAERAIALAERMEARNPSSVSPPILPYHRTAR